jgi:hypothetical protein
MEFKNYYESRSVAITLIAARLQHQKHRTHEKQDGSFCVSSWQEQHE